MERSKIEQETQPHVLVYPSVANATFVRATKVLCLCMEREAPGDIQ